MIYGRFGKSSNGFIMMEFSKAENIAKQLIRIKCYIDDDFSFVFKNSITT